MALIYIGAGINHFINEEFYLAIMPPYIPWHRLAVQLSGVAETALGLTLLITPLRALAAWGVILLLLAVFPANLHMALHPAATGAGDLPQWLLWLRLPLQAVLIAWAYAYTRPVKTSSANAS